MEPVPVDRAKQILAAIVASAVDGIIVIDSRGRIEAFNPAAERLFGYMESDVLGHNVTMLMPPPYRDEHDWYLSRYLSTGDARIIGTGREVQGLRRDGTVFPLQLSVGEMTIGSERKFTGIVHDLSARVRLEQQLRASEARWRAIIESAVDGIVVIDARGRIEAFNRAAERLFGYRESEVLGQNVSMLMPPPFRDEHDGYISRYVSTGQARIIGIGREVIGRRQDGTEFPVHLSVGETSLGGEQKFTGILHDLSSRVRLEAQLREQAALARLGEMAAVIAHEVKNPLAGIRGAIQVMGSRMAPDSRDSGVIDEIVSRIDALNGLIQDLLLFARPPTPKPIAVPVVPIIDASASLLRQDPALAGISIEVTGSSPLIVADPDLLKLVFVNLLMNGAHAMHGRGRLGVSIDATEVLCKVVISDAGPGIPPDIRDKVFTPFFTTKSRGTGLGLPTARRFVEAHKGSISIQCPPGGGTLVTVQLPLAEAGATHAASL